MANYEEARVKQLTITQLNKLKIVAKKILEQQ